MISTRTFQVKRPKIAAIAGLVCANLLSGCVGADVLPIQPAPLDRMTVTVADAKVVIGGMPGYCVNKRQSRDTITGAFVVLGPCKDAKEHGLKGLLVANVLAEETKSLQPEALDTYFNSDAGRTSLSTSGRAEAVEILGTMVESDVYFVHAIDKDAPMIPDTNTDIWRALFVVSNRLVSISMVSFTDHPVADGTVFSQLEQFATRIKQLNQ